MHLAQNLHPTGALSFSGRSRPFRDRAKRGTLPVMTTAVTTDEAALAHAAAAGDGQAFATLYERYEGRAFNLALRITGSREDAADATQDAFLNVMRRLPDMAGRELNFGSYLFTAARNACYDLIAKRRRADPTDEIPETAAPMAGGGGFGFDPGDPDDDPERGRLLDAQQEEIRAANERLPERHREVLALYELEEMSYDDIAEIMDMNRNSVAQLISRARIKLRDELRGTAMAAIATSTVECERALPLIAIQDDGQLGRGRGRTRVAGGAHRGLRHLPPEPRGDAGGRRLLPRLGTGGRRALPDEGDDGQGRRADRLGLERDDRRAPGGPRRRRGRGGRRRRDRHRERAAPPPSPRSPSSPPCWRAWCWWWASRWPFRMTIHPPTADPAAADVAPVVQEVKAKPKKSKKAKNEEPAAAAESDTPAATGNQPTGSPATGDTGQSTPTESVKKAPVKKRVTKQPTEEADPDPPVVEEPPVVVEPPPRTDDPPPCRPTRTQPRC